MEEQWKQVVGYEGLYEVSNLGQVRSLARYGTVGKILKPVVDNGGYLIVTLHNMKQKTHKIHRLVAMAFIPQLNKEYAYIDHINRVKTDNNVKNLRWVNRSMNSQNRDFVNQEIRKDNKSGKAGVRFHTKRNKWYAEIHHHSKKIYGGSFDTYEEAVKRREELEKQYFK